MVDGGAGAETGAEKRSLPAVVEAGRADGGSGSANMMDTVPLGMMDGSITSNHGEMGRQNRWDDMAPEVSSKGLDRISREEQKGDRTKIVWNELHGDKVSQEVTKRGYGPALKEDRILSPIGPKGKEGFGRRKHK